MSNGVLLNDNRSCLADDLIIGRSRHGDGSSSSLIVGVDCDRSALCCDCRAGLWAANSIVGDSDHRKELAARLRMVLPIYALYPLPVCFRRRIIFRQGDSMDRHRRKIDDACVCRPLIASGASIAASGGDGAEARHIIAKTARQR